MRHFQVQHRIKRAATLFGALALFLVLAGASRADAPPSMAGEWQTFWRSGQALMILSQQDDTVTGTYEPGRGKIEGRFDGRLLKGRWEQPGAAGSFLLALSGDGKTFTGRFDSGEYWNGRRIEDESAPSTRFSAAFSPRETLRTVITALNEAVFEGNSAASRFYEPLLIYENSEDSGTSDSTQSRQRASFWRVLNMSTFRIYEAPASSETKEAIFSIGPAGGKIRYDLKFRLDDDDRWKIVVEPFPVLERVIESMLKDLGHATVEDFYSASENSPRATMRTFMDGMRNWDVGGKGEALAMLDLSYLPDHLRDSEGPILADYLRQIIDRAGFVVWQEIPNDPNRPTPLVHYQHPHGAVVIERIKGEEDEPDRWLFSAETLRSAPVLFNAIQDMPVAPGLGELPTLTDFFRTRENIRAVSPSLLHRDFLLENWQWIALLLTVFAAIAGSWILARLIGLALIRYAGAAPAKKFQWPIRIFVGGAAILYGFGKLGIGQAGLSAVGQGIALITTLGLTMLVYRLTGLVGGYFIRRAEGTEGYVDEIVSSLATGLVKLLVVISGVVACADIVGLPYEGVITGLGVGGVALAFASRDTVSNMLGGMLLMADRPFKRGDLIETDGQFAFIEDVGLRSTRLKTFDDSLLIIPNAQLSDKAIVNWGKRRRRKVAFDIGLTYDTPREKLDLFVERLKSLYEDQPRADTSQYYSGLKNFNDSSIDVEFWGYFNVYGYEAHVRARHAFMGDVIDLVDELGLSFAFPTRMLHMAEESRSDASKRLPQTRDGRAPDIGKGGPEKDTGDKVISGEIGGEDGA